MIHRKKNYQLYKDATVSGYVISLMLLFIILFSVLFSFALLLLSLHILPFMAFSVAFLMFYQVLFHDCVVFQEHHSSLSAAFPGCFVGLFCPVLLGGCFLALCRAPISSDRFFIWHPLRPSSTQLLVNNHSGFCSHWYLAGLLFLLSTSFYRLCFCLPPCFSFKWFCSFFLMVCWVLFSLSASFQLVG